LIDVRIADYLAGMGSMPNSSHIGSLVVVIGCVSALQVEMALASLNPEGCPGVRVSPVILMR